MPLRCVRADARAPTLDRRTIRARLARVTARISIRGARTHNLKNLDLDLPRDRLVVITGPSGSGKSSLAFDTVYAEGRRRYVESLSVHARRFLGASARPPVDAMDGLSPAIAIAQRGVARSPRGTVGTLTELDDHLRLLLARVGEVRCPDCGEPVNALTPSEIVDEVLAMGEGTRAALLAPLARAQRGSHAALLEGLRKEGFVRARIDGAVVELDTVDALAPDRAHDIDLVVDRVVIKPDARARILDAVELCLRRGAGVVRVAPVDGAERALTSRFACARCGRVLPEIEPALFSFNSAAGACERCSGLGVREVADVARVIPDPSRSLKGGAVPAWKRSLPRELSAWAREMGVDLDLPWNELPARAQDELLHGDGDAFPGIVALLDEDAEDDAPGDRFTVLRPCDRCEGSRLRPEARAVRVAGADVVTLSNEPLVALRARLEALVPPPRRAAVAERILHEIQGRLGYLVDVGLGYLSLARGTTTLSSGEAQRARLATQLGGALVGVLYVLDEPTRGLHPTDRAQLRRTIRALVDRGNSVIVVEHDLDTIRAADHVVDMGPGAGPLGGRVLAEGAPSTLSAQPQSVTAPWLDGRRSLARAPDRPRAQGAVTLRGARLHNLKNVSVRIPLGTLSAVTGVSGSGKSSLILGTLVPHLRARIQGTAPPAAPLDALSVEGALDRVVCVDASPLGRSARSTPATITGVLDPLRDLFSSLPEARARGFKAARFSYNVKGGRCELCQGEGVVRVAMQFLADMAVPCEGCGGRRYEAETLAVRWRGMSIADVLDLTVDEALAQCEALERVRDPLRTLHEVGLGYLRLGQPATTLSGGEAQRVRLARELSRRSSARTLYVLDEPTAGLHPNDIEVLTHLLQRLVAQGGTVVLVEHDPAVVALADHVIDLGPGAGPDGGEVVVAGDVEAVRACARSRTGEALRARQRP